MSNIIDSTYEIIGKLGAGGGGVVYLANHLRLGKKVVLKVDKRSINTRAELLRREVDILKELNHTYIPQVYDYFIEDGFSYTVMDYVDGESLNKVLEREKQFPQPTVIHWARQLLEALSYLHSPTHGDPPRGFIHSDIKPGNIMLRPNGDICLIDYNISLAIGIESIVGRSPGYSSPEHYGLDYSEGLADSESNNDTATEVEIYDDKTELASGASVAEATDSVKKSELSSSLKRVTVLDARSDIYSVGATLYHLLSGKRPNNDAKNVEPLSKKQFSPLLVDIITKAMNPNPELRFHTANEMLAAINGLWDNDPRVIRRKKRLAVTSSLLALLLISGGMTVFTGLKQMERLETAHVLAAKSTEALSGGDVKGAINYACEALADDPGLFGIPYTSDAQLALTNALGIYDLSDSFKPYLRIDLPSAPFRVVKSPDETKILVCYAYELAIYELETGELIKTLPTLESALCEVEFLSDIEIIYGGKDGITAYNIQSDEVLWQSTAATAITVSGDKSTVAAINGNDDNICFYDAKTGELISCRSLGGKHLNIPENDRFADSFRDVFELNNDGSMCAVSLNNGFLGFIDAVKPEKDLIVYEDSEYSYFDGKFIDTKFAFSAAGAPGALFGIIDCKAGQYIGDMEGNSKFELCTYGGKLFVSQNDTIVEFNTETFEQAEIAYTENKNIKAFDISEKYAVAATDDSYTVFFGGAGQLQTESCETEDNFVIVTNDFIALADRNSPSVEILKLRKYDDMRFLDYDPQIKHSEARLKADRSSVMLFNINGFSILNPDGSVRITVPLPESEKIYDQQYRSNGDYLEVTYYSGKIVCYSADNGEIISETDGPAPDESLDEEFETDNYIIKAPLHGIPIVYDKVSGEKIAELNSEDYLTYITEIDNYIVAQYISADGKFYGVLMNKSCEPVAQIPYLCDVSGNSLVYDFPSGNIKISPIYKLEELKIKAENYWN